MRRVVSSSPIFDVTGLARGLADKHSVLITDPSRDLCLRYGFQTLYEAPVDLQKMMRRELIRDHVEKLRANRDVVFDHAVFGWLADWMRWLWSETSAAEWESVLAEAEPAAVLSESIHHVVSGPVASYDGYRWLDRRNAAQIEWLLRHLYREFGCEARIIEVQST